MGVLECVIIHPVFLFQVMASTAEHELPGSLKSVCGSIQTVYGHRYLSPQLQQRRLLCRQQLQASLDEKYLPNRHREESRKLRFRGRNPSLNYVLPAGFALSSSPPFSWLPNPLWCSFA